MEATFVPPGSFVSLCTAGSRLVVIVVIIRRKLHATKGKLQIHNVKVVTCLINNTSQFIKASS